MFVQGLVDFGDRSGQRSIYIGGSLYGLHYGAFFTGGHGTADRRQLHEGEVAQLFLGEFRYAHCCRIAFNTHPFMGLGIPQVFGNIHIIHPPSLHGQINTSMRGPKQCRLSSNGGRD